MSIKRAGLAGGDVTSRWKRDGFYVSPYNYDHEARAGLNFPKKVTIHDVTLRDGEQQCGIVFRKGEKVRIASALDEAGVNRIEAGLASDSQGETEALSETCQLLLHAQAVAVARRPQAG